MENYPQLKKEHLKLENDNFRYYCNWANKIVENIQFNSNEKTEVPLTFYPIAKNIRLPSSHMVHNILQNKASFIGNNPRNGDISHWQNFLKRGSWYPWLWARGRIEGYCKNIDGWKFYFDSFTEKHHKIYNNEELKEPPHHLKIFFVYLACINYTFQLNKSYLSIMDGCKKKMNWPSSEKKILAVQIRRGETCSKSCSKADREVLSLNEYIEKMEVLLKSNDYEYIYISTDSDEEIGRIKEAKPEWNILSLPIDRSQFFRMNEDAPPTKNGFSGLAIDLEDSCRLYPGKIPFVVDSGLADLYFVSQCQGYISTLSEGEFSKCGWYLQLCTQKNLTPYINVNTKEINMKNQDQLLML